MRRRLSAVAAAFSLLLCLAVLGLWTRSYWHGDMLTVLRRDNAGRRVTQHYFYSGRGLLYVERVVYVFGTPEASTRFAPRPGVSLESVDPTNVKLDGRGILVVRSGTDRNGVAYAIAPHWFIALGLLSPFLTWLVPSWVRHRRQRLRAAARCCPNCGYSLTANTSGVCPECGTPIAGTAGAKA